MKSNFLRTICFIFTGSITSIVAGQTVVGPGQFTPVFASTDEDFILNGGTLSPADLDQGGSEVILTGSIELQSNSVIIRPQNSFTTDNRGNLFEVSTEPVTLAGPISGVGDIELGNLSRNELVIGGDNTYDGHTYITSGFIRATTSTAFGSTNGGTTVQDGFVRIRTATDESFRIEGGSLVFEAPGFEPNGPIAIAGGIVSLPQRDLYEVPVIVDGSGGTLQLGFGNNNASWTGGSSGTGSLTIRGRGNVDAPLTHNGDLIIDGLKLNTVNSYTGRTIIIDSYLIDRADVFGTSTTPIEIDDAQVTVNVLPTGDRGFTVRRGTLNIQTAEPINGNIILGGRFEANIRGNGTFNGPIDYITTSGGGNAHLLGGTFNGPIRGDTNLRLGGSEDVILNAANKIEGLASITGGHVVVNNPQALTVPATHIQGGLVEFNAPIMGLPFMTRYPFGSRQTGTLRLNVDQNVKERWYLESGAFESTADASFDRLLTYAASVNTSGVGQVKIDGELLSLASGAVSGKIVGTGNMRTVGTSFGVTGDLSGFEGNFIVEHGDLVFGRAGSFTEPYLLNPDSDIHVYPGGSVNFGTEDGVIMNDIFLHDTQGTFFEGPLNSSGNGDHTLAGIIDVGNVGSTIAEDFLITGTLRGSNLTISHRGLRFQSLQDQLAGKLTIKNEGTLWLDRNASFPELSEIDLQDGIIYLGESAITDRIEDTTLVRSQGGNIFLISSSRTPTSETIGRILLDRGQTTLVASSDHGSLAATLIVDTLTREKGTVIHFDEAGNATSTKLNNVSVFEGKMIGGWAIRDDGFASIDASGLVSTLAPTSSNLNTATSSDHVKIAGNATLSSDKSIASLQHDSTGNPLSLDLNGHRLRIRSGGILRSGAIQNGSITAGDIAEDAELIIHQSTDISADIVDNSATGSVAFVMASDRHGTVLSGNNSYTGGTWVLGNGGFRSGDAQLIINDFAAIPESDRVYVEGGRYELTRLGVGIVELAELHLRGGGLITGFNAPIDADMTYLEHGRVNAPFIGSGSFYKDSDQTVSFENTESPNFMGAVYVRDGILDSGDLLPNASYVIEGGLLEAEGDNNIILDGGSLSGTYSGSVQVASESTLFHNGNTQLRGMLSGDADLKIDGVRDDRSVQISGDTSQFSGDFHVQSGALGIGASAQLGPSTIYVNEGARLTISSQETGSGRSSVANEIHLNGGALQGSSASGIASGDVYVHGEAFLGASSPATADGQNVAALLLAGNLMLDDEAHVYGIDNRSRSRFYSGNNRLVEVSGTLHVGQNNVWHLGTAALGISGSIKPTAPNSSIDFQGVPSSLVLDGATIETFPGKNLRIVVNGKPQKLTLADPGAGLTGNGTVFGDFDVMEGASVAPGDSPGNLTVDGNLSFGPGARYLWEFAGGAGGPGLAWDLLTVEGILDIQATAESPWVLVINELNDALQFEDGEWLIATAKSIDGFDPNSIEVIANNTSSKFQYSTADDFLVETRGNDLYLVLTVPEPTCICLICCLAAFSVFSQRMLGCRHR